MSLPAPAAAAATATATTSVNAADGTAATNTSASSGQLVLFRQLHINYILQLSRKAMKSATPPTTTAEGAASESGSTDEPDSLEAVMSQHLKVSGMYWCLTSLALLDSLDTSSSSKMRAAITHYLMHAYHPAEGGWGGSTDDECHLLYTCSAVQTLCLLDVDLSGEMRSAAIEWLVQLYNPSDGSWAGDPLYREIDTRFSYCAILSLALLQALPSAANQYDEQHVTLQQLDATMQWLAQCRNYDGGYGAVPGAESHSGQIFTVVACQTIIKAHVGQHDTMQRWFDIAKPGSGSSTSTSAIPLPPSSAAIAPSSQPTRPLGMSAPSLNLTPTDLLCAWLCDRQLHVAHNQQHIGGLNGRPEKLVDVCYSWWVLASLQCMQRKSWISLDHLLQFILRCQDVDLSDDDDANKGQMQGGGISDRPNNQADPFHTYFGLAAVSMIHNTSVVDEHGHAVKLRPINAHYALPQDVVERMQLPDGYL